MPVPRFWDHVHLVGLHASSVIAHVFWAHAHLLGLRVACVTCRLSRCAPYVCPAPSMHSSPRWFLIEGIVRLCLRQSATTGDVCQQRAQSMHPVAPANPSMLHLTCTGEDHNMHSAATQGHQRCQRGGGVVSQCLDAVAQLTHAHAVQGCAWVMQETALCVVSCR